MIEIKQSSANTIEISRRQVRQCKSAKEVVHIIDSSPVKQPDPAVWIDDKDFGIRLTQQDKTKLTSRGWLTDSHMNAVQKLLKKQFPAVCGLQDTIITQTLTCNVETGEFLQIFHVRGCHWVAVSTIGCAHGEVEVYDSLRKGLCAASLKALASIMHSPLTLKIMNVQSQPNSTDCGPFAAAYVTELCYGRKPIDINFCVPRMRDHMKKCFLRRRMTPFPSEIRRAVRCTEIRRVHCIVTSCVYLPIAKATF